MYTKNPFCLLIAGCHRRGAESLVRPLMPRSSGYFNERSMPTISIIGNSWIKVLMSVSCKEQIFSYSISLGEMVLMPG